MIDLMPTFRARAKLALIVGLPFFALWALVTISTGQVSIRDALAISATSVGSALLLGGGVWYLCLKWPWPLQARTTFYFLQVLLAAVYAVTWNLLICGIESLRDTESLFNRYWTSRNLGWQLLTGILIYLTVAGLSYSVQTRQQLHEREMAALRAEALAATARMDAIRARLNPHFLFNALHTLAALIKLSPAIADAAFERLGDMLRYALRDDNRELIEFTEEYEFARQYIGFEQLRYEDRLKVSFEIDSRSYEFDLPPFSIQTLLENAVRHAISIRPVGGSVWVYSACRDDVLCITVRDDGPGENVVDSKSSQFGLKSLQERLHLSFGTKAHLETTSGPDGFEARFSVPLLNPWGQQPGWCRIVNHVQNMAVLIADDEPLARRSLRLHLNDLAWSGDIHEARDGKAAISIANSRRPDLLFLDIVMPGATGLQVLESLEYQPKVIFTTAHDKFAVTAFELGALDYLLKPFGRERLARVVSRLESPASDSAVSFADRAQESLGPARSLSRIFVRDRNRIVPIPLLMLERAQGADDYVTIHATGREYLVSVRLAELETQLSGLNFLRIHRSHIINVDLIESISPFDANRVEVTMKGGTRIVASRSGSKLLRDLAL